MKTFNVRILYAYKFISQCLPIYAFYTILFVQRGQSTTEIAVLIALWSAFTIVFEVPSGILADRWNRRNILVLSAVFQGVCFIVWFFAHTFLIFAAGFVFWAVSGAFASGTEEGLIYDNLKYDGNEASFADVYGKAQFYANAGTVVGLATAGVMASFISIEAITLISAAVCFINIIFIIQLREKNYYSARLKIENEAPGFLSTFKEAGAFIKGSKIALLAILFLVLVANTGNYLDEFDALIVNDMRLTPIWVSVILTVRFIFISLGDILAPKLKGVFSSVNRIFLLGGVACALLAVFAVIWHQYAIPLLGLAVMFMAITEILLVDALQGEVKEEGRATVTSIYSVGQNVVMICFSLIYAALAGFLALSLVYLIIAIVGIAGTAAFSFSRIRNVSFKNGGSIEKDKI